MKLNWFCRRSRGCVLALVISLVPVSRTHAQGALTNGWSHTGAISPAGDSDTWTFSTGIGDRIVIRAGEITQTGSFSPRIRLLNPSAVLVASASKAVAPEVVFTATNSGLFTVIVDDAIGSTATGTYRLTLAKSPGDLFVSPDDEGGPLTNGVSHQATLPPGDLDVWNFTANTGESIVLKLGQLSETNNFDPWLRLYGPNGVLLGSDASVWAAEVALRATNSGTFTVVIANDPYYTDAASGTYRLKLAKTGSPYIVLQGEEGGEITHGMAHQGNLPLGDLDLWNFTASAGDSLVLKIGQLSDTNNFDPWIRLYGPDGALLGSVQDASAAEVTLRATNSGTFLAVIGNYPYYSDAAAGAYRLKLAKTGSPFVVSPGDEGGPMTNGAAHQGNLPLGDLDLWDFTANTGDSIVLKAGQITDVGNFDPWIRLYGPNGALLGSVQDNSAAEVTVRATNSGTFLVVIGNYPYYSDTASGTYRLKLAKTGDPIVVSTGDEGGPMTNGTMHAGTITVGDLDVWNFAANTGQSFVVRVGQVTDLGSFDPWVRVYGPNGLLLGSDFGTVVGEAAFRATNSGTFMVLVSNNPYNSDAGNGAYLLTLAKTGNPIVVSPGDEGGPMTNGVAHQGNIPVGDLDVWNFSAISGEAIIVRIGQRSDTNSFDPWVRLYGPDGTLLGSDFGAAVGEVAVRATNSGTFLVVTGNNDYNNNAGSGTYLLTLAKTGSPIVVSSGDEGGSMTGVGFYDGVIAIGDLDLWTFTLCAGGVMDVRLDEINETNSFAPWIRLYGPNGVLVRSVFGAATSEVALAATNSGTFLVVIGNSDYYNNAGSGAYRLSVNGLSDGLKACAPVVSGTNATLGGVGGTAGATYVLVKQTNVSTPMGLWTPIRTNQFDQFGVFSVTNGFSRSQLQQYFRLLLP